LPLQQYGTYTVEDKYVIKCIITHTQLYSPFEKAAQLYTHKMKMEKNLTSQQDKTLKRYLMQSTQ